MRVTSTHEELGSRVNMTLFGSGKEVIEGRKRAIESCGKDHKEDILSRMLNYELENPDYTIEEQVDDFLTFIVAGKSDRTRMLGGSAQPRLKMYVLGHSLVCLLICSHRSLT